MLIVFPVFPVPGVSLVSPVPRLRLVSLVVGVLIAFGHRGTVVVAEGGVAGMMPMRRHLVGAASGGVPRLAARDRAIHALTRIPATVQKRPQPLRIVATVSGHLSVLRRCGLVSIEVKRNQRIHSLSGTTALCTIASVQRFLEAARNEH